MIYSNKIFQIFLILLLSINNCFADNPSKTEVERIIKANGLGDSPILSEYHDEKLIVDTKNTTVNKLVLISNVSVIENKTASDALVWYRAVSISEFNQMSNHEVACIDDRHAFCGISPQYDYSKKYLTNKKPGILLQFRTKGAGWLYNLFTNENGCKVKAEGGGMYGLGPKGSYKSCTKNKGLLNKRGAMGELFNQLIMQHEIISHIDYILLKRKT